MSYLVASGCVYWSACKSCGSGSGPQMQRLCGELSAAMDGRCGARALPLVVFRRRVGEAELNA